MRVRQYPWGMAEGILLNGAISTVIKTEYLQKISLVRQKCDKPMLICNKLGKIAKSIVKQSVQLGQQTIFFSVNRRKTPEGFASPGKSIRKEHLNYKVLSKVDSDVKLFGMYSCSPNLKTAFSVSGSRGEPLFL